MCYEVPTLTLCTVVNLVVFSYAGPSSNRPIWLGRLQCTSSSNALGGCGRLDPAIGSTVHCRDHSLNNINDAAVNCNRTFFSDDKNQGT